MSAVTAPVQNTLWNMYWDMLKSSAYSSRHWNSLFSLPEFTRLCDLAMDEFVSLPAPDSQEELSKRHRYFLNLSLKQTQITSAMNKVRFHPRRRQFIYQLAEQFHRDNPVVSDKSPDWMTLSMQLTMIM